MMRFLSYMIPCECRGWMCLVGQCDALCVSCLYGLCMCLRPSVAQNTYDYDDDDDNTIQYNTIQYNTIQYNTIHTSILPHIWGHLASYDYQFRLKVLNSLCMYCQLPNYRSFTLISFPADFSTLQHFSFLFGHYLDTIFHSRIHVPAKNYDF